MKGCNNLVSVVAADLVDQKQARKKKKWKIQNRFLPDLSPILFFFSIFQNYAHDSHKLCLRLSNGPRRIPQHSLSACTGDSYFFRRATSDEGKGPSINDVTFIWEGGHRSCWLITAHLEPNLVYKKNFLSQLLSYFCELHLVFWLDSKKSWALMVYNLLAEI